jgi:hypothetical protein
MVEIRMRPPVSRMVNAVHPMMNGSRLNLGVQDILWGCPW